MGPWEWSIASAIDHCPSRLRVSPSVWAFEFFRQITMEQGASNIFKQSREMINKVIISLLFQNINGLHIVDSWILLQSNDIWQAFTQDSGIVS